MDETRRKLGKKLMPKIKRTDEPGWKSKETMVCPRTGDRFTNEKVIAAIMYLCAQPKIAKEIRKLWRVMPDED
jgi:hypothetical protein